jgi:hypothetical protein
MTKYTVVGFYRSNNQCFTETFEDESAAAAIDQATEKGVSVVDVLVLWQGEITSMCANDSVIFA